MQRKIIYNVLQKYRHVKAIIAVVTDNIYPFYTETINKVHKYLLMFVSLHTDTVCTDNTYRIMLTI